MLLNRFVAIACVLLLFVGGAAYAFSSPQQPEGASPQATINNSACATLETPLNMGDPFALAYNPVNRFIYVLRAGTTTPQVVALQYGREVARINFPSGSYRELTSLGVNPTTGIVYITQWSNDTVHFVKELTRIGSYSGTGNFGPAGVWANPSTNSTYVSGKWYAGSSKSVSFQRTSPAGTVSMSNDADPNAGVVAANNGYLYLALSNVDQVAVINGGTLISNVTVGDHPNGIVYNPSNGYVYTVNRGTAATQSSVSIIDGTTVVATVTLGPGYDERLGVNSKDAITLWGNTYYGGTDIAAVDPNTGYVYVSNWGANTVSVISGTTLLATLPVGLHPNSIVYNPVTGLVYVANTGDDTVMVIRGSEVVQTITVGDYPIDLAVDTQSGLIYTVNRRSDSLSTIRCHNNMNEKRLLGHYVAWYKTPFVRGGWGNWERCSHDPGTITQPHGFRDIAAIHYPLIGPYDSADPNVIEYHLLQAWAAGVDTFVIDWYGEDDPDGIDEATRQLFQQVEAMNARYDTDFRLVLMYDEGALLGEPDPIQAAQSDFTYMLNQYAGSPAYLWANGKPVAFYFAKGPILTPTGLATVTADFSLVNQDFPDDYLPIMNGAYAWIKGSPFEPDGSNWGEEYLQWWYPTFDFHTVQGLALIYGVGGVWAGFHDGGVGEEWSCIGNRRIDRQDGAVYDKTWQILFDYNASIGITYTVPISWVQLITMNDHNEGTELFATVPITGVEGVDYGFGYGYQYVQKTEDHVNTFNGRQPDALEDIYFAQHLYNARLVSRVISNTTTISNALVAFYEGNYTGAMVLADAAAGIPAPVNVRAHHTTDGLYVTWQDQPGAVLASGHRVYYGLASGQHITSTLVSTGSSTTIPDLMPGETYYVVVTTLGATHPHEAWYVSESWNSAEVIVQPLHAFYLPLVMRASN